MEAKWKNDVVMEFVPCTRALKKKNLCPLCLVLKVMSLKILVSEDERGQREVTWTYNEILWTGTGDKRGRGRRFCSQVSLKLEANGRTLEEEKHGHI